jgi:SAM-dependent methyltransferase
MKRTLDEHASRFDEHAPDYDDESTPEYRACVDLVVRLADSGPDDVVLDLGAGTGAISLALAQSAGEVVGRDISEGMLAEARRKADERGIENVSFGEGRFREPNVAERSSAGNRPSADNAEGDVDVVVSNFAMHHLSDAEKREAIQVVADLEPRRFVLGDVMFFGHPDPDEPFYSPEVDDPATVGVLVEALTDAGFVVTAVESVHEQVGVIAAERETPSASPNERAATDGSRERRDG